MSGKLRTVRGDVEPEMMGGTLPHEHLLIDEDMWWRPGTDDRADRTKTGAPTLETLWHWLEYPTVNRGNLHFTDEQTAINEIAGLPGYGIGTIIEVTNVGLGRDIRGLKRISEATGLHIVSGTSFYIAHSLSDEVKAMDEEQMVEFIVGDIEQGVDGTDIKAGVIGEVGISWPMEPVEERSLAASVKAMHMTGAALTLHSPYYLRDVMILKEICDRLEDLGADMKRVIMGHSDSFTRDPRFVDVAAGLKCMIQFDLFGTVGYEPSHNFVYPSDEVRVDTIGAMVQAGMADRLMLSHDVGLKTCMKTYGGHGYDYVPRFIVPWLLRAGVDKNAIEQIVVRNGQRIFPLAPVTAAA